jgi:hypothetical protein
MFKPNPIAEDYVPYTMRSNLRNNADLLVDSGSRARIESRVNPQQSPFTGGPCDNKNRCDPCGLASPIDPALDPVCSARGGFCLTRQQVGC